MKKPVSISSTNWVHAHLQELNSLLLSWGPSIFYCCFLQNMLVTFSSFPVPIISYWSYDSIACSDFLHEWLKVLWILSWFLGNILTGWKVHVSRITKLEKLNKNNTLPLIPHPALSTPKSFVPTKLRGRFIWMDQFQNQFFTPKPWCAL